MTFVLGLTGSIGMGKSTTSTLLKGFGVPVHDADATVHALYRGAAAGPIEAAFPGVVVGGVVDRAALSRAVLGRPEALAVLEAIVHSLVRAAERGFLEACRSRAVKLAVLDVPLLLETGGKSRCDAVLVVTAPADVQRARVLSRRDMTPDKLDAILARQMPDAQKRRQAHFLVDSSAGLLAAQRQLRSMLSALAGRPGHVLSREAPPDA